VLFTSTPILLFFFSTHSLHLNDDGVINTSILKVC
jgi:hypothetical protein